VEHGPVDVLFLTFPADVPLEDVVRALRQPVDAGAIRLVDCVLMLPTGDGTVSVVDLEEEAELPGAMAGLDIDANDLLSDLDIEVFVESLAEGELGVAVVYEQVWAQQAIAALEGLGAEIGLFVHVPVEDVELAFAAAQQDREARS
jgi:hypothetical protein